MDACTGQNIGWCSGISSSSMTYYQELPANVQEVLQKHGLNSLEEVLLYSESKASKFLDLPKHVLEDVKLAAAKSLSKDRFMSASQAYTSLSILHQSLSTGCQILNDFLHGGLALRGITEITGESGTGKTQVCLQLSLSVQYREVYGGMNAGAVFINTEKVFPTRRLHELVQKFSPFFQDRKVAKPDINFGDNIFLEHIPDADSLVKCITRSLPLLLKRKNIGLVVIDSIAGVFRTDYDQKDLIQRAHDLQIIGKQLHKLARKFCLAVVCVNQVSSVPVDSFENRAERSQTVAALSLAWANLVTTRLQLFRDSGNISDELPSKSLVPRTMEVIFSPYLPQSSCKFSVSSEGVFGIR